ncbi:GbsR/MarR family transcriptional regulator [Haoranjiania flava]|uniref:MarR family transcriptional regulator n=1 Tax=Haoranjiania flava TaxID=1856322 RepID=A0AAE3INF1_9BACT|nr:helix-turn-helix domain-containing protein [Haoranjiania flava]MCU7694206.1 MarR family transcriptional regulator [Haoranjiania flava]
MEKYRQSIENTALVWEQMGLSPVSSRVLAYIMYAPHYSATFEDLTDYFNVSKSAISNAIKYLTLVQMVGSRTKGGQRKRYFGMELTHLFESSDIVKKYKLLNTMTLQVLKERKENDELKTELKNLTIFFDMLIKEFPLLVKKWKEEIQ